MSLSAKLRIFAGLCTWKIPEAAELAIECGSHDSGIIALGNLKIVKVEQPESAPALSGKKVTVTLDGKTYSATID
jgi:hypothetical protein